MVTKKIQPITGHNQLFEGIKHMFTPLQLDMWRRIMARSQSTVFFMDTLLTQANGMVSMISGMWVIEVNQWLSVDIHGLLYNVQLRGTLIVKILHHLL